MSTRRPAIALPTGFSGWREQPVVPAAPADGRGPARRSTRIADAPPMSDGAVFVDTNVFAYALDDGEPSKRDSARETIEVHRRQIIVSTQVLLELHAVCTRRLGMDREVTGRAVRAVALFPVVGADRELILDAVTLATDAQLSVFDAAIVAAAARGGCATLLSEDLNDGQLLGGVQVRNPFAPAA